MNKICVYPRCYPRLSASTPKIIAFDFDRTLFDTERFKIALANSLKEYGIPPKIWRQTYKTSIPTNLQKYQIYTPEKHAEIISKITGVKKEKILKSFEKVVKNSHKFVYGETVPVLKFLKNKKFKLHLVSFGNIKHQQKKFANSEILKYFDKVIISQKPKVAIKFPPPPLPSPSARGRDGVGVVLVDDNPLEIKNLYKKYKNKIVLVWLNRENKNVKFPKSVIKIKNLKSLLSLSFPDLIGESRRIC